MQQSLHKPPRHVPQVKPVMHYDQQLHSGAI
jgi:hypothetical protein